MKETETEQLYRRHYQQMIGLARTMLYDEEEARDVVSEVFASLVQTDVTPRNVENYLMTSVRNRCLNLIEHKNVRTKFEQAYAIEIKHHDNYEDLTATTVDQQYQQLMAYARHRMTEQTLRVFQMRHLQGMKYQEIADQLGISRVMVYKHLVKAMTSMSWPLPPSKLSDTKGQAMVSLKQGRWMTTSRLHPLLRTPFRQMPPLPVSSATTRPHSRRSSPTWPTTTTCT